jgi:alkylation response protein AidB-like acyl-CoA dehydrogenase
VLNGRKAVVVGAPWATHFIVTARTAGNQRDREGLAAFLIPAHTSGIVLRNYPTVDGARAAEMSLDNVRVEASSLLTHATDGFAVIERVVDEAIAATCAEAVGALRKLQEGTLDYSRQRKQFGAPIGSFQVIQHRLVDMFMELEQSVSAMLMATLKLDAPRDERAKFVSAAKVQISKACKFIGQNAIQIHGGMGMTDELAIGHYFKRTTIIEGLYGSAEHHLKRFESLSRSGSALVQGKRAA